LKYNEKVDVEHLSKMSNLRLLIIKFGGNISGSLSCLSNELRYVKWDVYPFKDLPSSFHPNELVELILERSKIKQLWKNKKVLNIVLLLIFIILEIQTNSKQYSYNQNNNSVFVGFSCHSIFPI
jgi:hypothetical protein